MGLNVGVLIVGVGLQGFGGLVLVVGEVFGLFVGVFQGVFGGVFEGGEVVLGGEGDLIQDLQIGLDEFSNVFFF